LSPLIPILACLVFTGRSVGVVLELVQKKPPFPGSRTSQSCTLSAVGDCSKVCEWAHLPASELPAVVGPWALLGDVLPAPALPAGRDARCLAPRRRGSGCRCWECLVALVSRKRGKKKVWP